ncbi:hypothetical protein [Vibrio breoganii]|nr:hypothetical protein [Vibrio breoganii]
MASRYFSECEIQTLALSKILNQVQDDACALLSALHHVSSNVLVMLEAM